MTMPHEKKGSIWSKAQQDRDIDDLIFEAENQNDPYAVTVSDR